MGNFFSIKLCSGSDTTSISSEDYLISGEYSGQGTSSAGAHYGTHSQTPTTSSSSSSQPSKKRWQKLLSKTTQRSLKEMYLTRFQKVNPFSLPFTFNIENTWESLAFKENYEELKAKDHLAKRHGILSRVVREGEDDEKHLRATEDHAHLLEQAFKKAKMLIIEGNPATGKTSLMRRLAYGWAKGKQELAHYNLVLYAEFREVSDKSFKSVADLVLGGLEKYLDKKDIDILRLLLNDKHFCRRNRILVLLDGYDESSSDKQCLELSTYLTERRIKKRLLFNTVITTRKGPLSDCREFKGRYIFAEVLGFTTKQQKLKYVYNHFLSQDIDNKENIAAVHTLLNNNKNLNKLAETPLLLIFICFVHERIVDGTLLELYCNIIWWLIDRHQQDFPDRDIPSELGFENDFSDKLETIQDNYLHFPQLYCLGKMALQNLEENVFKDSDCALFNVQPIIEQVGLLRRKEEYANSFKLATSYYIPHRTIQNFLAAFYCFCSDDDTSEWLLQNSILDVSEEMNEFEKFLLRIALSDKMPVQAEKRLYYFEGITGIELDITFDAFNTKAGFNIDLLNLFISQCTNVEHIKLIGTANIARRARNMVNDASVQNESTITPSNIFSLTLLSFTNCPSLKHLEFVRCFMESSTTLGIATLPTIDTVEFDECTFEADSQLSLTNCSSLKNLKFTKCEMENSLNLGIATLPPIYSVEFDECTFEADFQLSFTNCPYLKDLIFSKCEIKSSRYLGIDTLPAIDTVQIYRCLIDLATWNSITDAINDSTVKCLNLSADYFAAETYLNILNYLQKCERIEQLHVKDDYNILNRYDEEVTANLEETAQVLPGLTSITTGEYGRTMNYWFRLKEKNKERIEKAGQERNPDFLVKYL